LPRPHAKHGGKGHGKQRPYERQLIEEEFVSVEAQCFAADMADHVWTSLNQERRALICPIRQLLYHLEQLVELDGLGQLAVETGLLGLIAFQLLVVTRQCDGFEGR